MKILYVGHFHEDSGWGRAIKSYARSLIRNRVDLCIRSIKIGNSNVQLDADLQECLEKPKKDYDVVIQHVLPQYIEKYPGCKNVAVYINEFLPVHKTQWYTPLRLMDKTVTTCNTLLNDLSNGGIGANLVPHATDTELYDKQYEFFDIEDLKNKFVFYFIGEHMPRKSISRMVKCFYQAFYGNPSVVLLIKTHLSGAHPTELANNMQAEFKNLRNILGMGPDYMYPKELLITDRVHENYIYGLHKVGDCFVTASYGEAWQYPAFDAVCFGNKLISPNTFAFADWEIPTYQDYRIDKVYELDAIKGQFHNANHYWYSISEAELIKMYKQAYQDKTTPTTSQILETRQFANNYSYSKIGRRFLETL